MEVVQKIVAYRTAVPTPVNNSGWYLPSEKELALLSGTANPALNVDDNQYGRDNYDLMNTKIQTAVAAGASGVQLQPASYWSSTEKDDGAAWLVLLPGVTTIGSKYQDRCRVRAICAF